MTMELREKMKFYAQFRVTLVVNVDFESTSLDDKELEKIALKQLKNECGDYEEADILELDYA